MLYSQKDGYVFDLTYACHEAIEQYKEFERHLIPFKNYVNKNNSVDKIYVSKVLPQKMHYNLDYLKEFSVVKDFKISILTVISVLKPRMVKRLNGSKNEI